eukprot:gnl/TRDRNA2_/TRDRNA2_139597_c2_seq2.p1 gnl/TRDRNA2_/TRDRNA2_139597_c2~~gnl/TRDRNA2_/TRDRNA2_139597_c2_seq2.p1  ORF type:complete len:217 (-),score=45.01 gnl/TRDRNA2_/TRDRNA2_139597_c2_seq2:434-1084(-)
MCTDENSSRRYDFFHSANAEEKANIQEAKEHPMSRQEEAAARTRAARRLQLAAAQASNAVQKLDSLDRPAGAESTRGNASLKSSPQASMLGDHLRGQQLPTLHAIQAQNSNRPEPTSAEQRQQRASVAQKWSVQSWASPETEPSQVEAVSIHHELSRQEIAAKRTRLAEAAKLHLSEAAKLHKELPEASPHSSPSCRQMLPEAFPHSSPSCQTLPA